jgi:hypothetical protein
MKIETLLALFAISASTAYSECCPPGASQDPCASEQYKGVYRSLHSARPCIGSTCSEPGWGGALELSFLFWQAREDNLAFALKNTPLFAPSIIAADVNGPLETIHFGWDPAFKLNFDQRFGPSWDFASRWTYFYTRSTHSAHSATNTVGSGLLPLWVLPQSSLASPNVFGKAKGIWHLHLNTFDFELGYNPLFTKKLSMRIHCGIKGMSINQQFTVSYSEGINDGTVTLLPSKAALRHRCLGMGPRLGFDSEWRLKKGWALLADGSGSLILCDFNIKRKDFDYAIGPAFYNRQSKFHESFYAYRPNFEGKIGIGWRDCYGCRKQYEFDFQAAYEIQYYWEQNMMRQMAAEQISFSAYSLRGDLHCHGLTTTFGFGF